MGVFRFKKFSIDDTGCAMKIGTDGVLLGAWTKADGAMSIIDIGTGTGLIALMMAQRYDNIRISGIEIDSHAAKVAQQNAKSSPWSKTVEIINTDIMQWCERQKVNDETQLPHPICIVSNPPFYTEAIQSPDVIRALARHGNNFHIISLIEIVSKLMDNPSDSLSFIAPIERDNDIMYAMSLHRLSAVRITDVITRQGRKPLRRLYELKPDCGVNIPCKYSHITIRNEAGDYSCEYISLTGQYYLNL